MRHISCNLSSHCLRKGFSLVEVLLAVFILGIGILSISVLFPAGIELQRQSKDAINGPLVAQQAIQLIRNRLSEEDFGDLITFAKSLGENEITWEAAEENASPPEGRLPGDWGWRRPGLRNLNDLKDVSTGTIRVFCDASDASFIQDLPTELNRSIAIPWNSELENPPQADIAQGERCWPEAGAQEPPSVLGSADYFWDCLFSRKKGRIYVAVFVYRVSGNKEIGKSYAVLPNSEGASWMPAVHQLDASWGPPSSNSGSFAAAAVANRGAKIISVTGDPAQSLNSWQRPDQRLVDQSGRTHLVLVGKRSENETPSVIELKNAPKAFFDMRSGEIQPESVQSFWFVPMISPLLPVASGEVEITLRPIHAEVFTLSGGGSF